MSNTVIEIAEIKLANGKTEAELVSAAERLREGFLSQQSGFISHDLVRQSDGVYADIVRWETMGAAKTALQNAESSPVCGAYFSHMEIDPENPIDGVSYFPVLSSSSTN